MLTVAEHIELLLLDNDCVTIACLGTFQAHYRAATLIDGTHTYAPPTRELCFSTKLEGDETLLPTAIAQQQQISIEEANTIVSKAVVKLQKRLATDKKVSFGSIGHFVINKNNLLLFEASSTPLVRADMLGFAPITLSPLLNRVEQPTEHISKTPFIEREEETIHIRFSRHRLHQAVAVAIIALFMMLISAPVEQVVVKQDYAALLSTQLFTETILPEASPAFELPVDEPTMVEIATPAETVVEAPQIDKRCYWIIVSSLRNQELADNEIDKLTAKYGINSFETHPSADRVRISLQGFETMALAQAFLKEQQANTDFPFKDAWVLKRTRS